MGGFQRREWAQAAVGLVLMMLVGGCSTQQLYATAQEMQKAECSKMSGDARESCLRNTSMSYEKYEEERSRAAKGSQ